MAGKLSIKNIATKAMGVAVVKYREMRKAGQVPAIAVMDQLSKFYGKKGQILKRQTRYQTQLTTLQDLISKAREQLGSKTPGKASLQRKGEEIRQRIAKGGKTYAKDQGAKDNRFTRVAREKAAEYYKMTQVFASETYDKLKEGSYGIGSGFVQALIKEGWSDDDAILFLKQIEESMGKDLPDSAHGLATADEFWGDVWVMTKIMQEGGLQAEEFKAIFTGYMSANDTGEFKAAVENYIAAKTDIPFSEIWEKLKEYGDITSEKNMREVIDNIEG